MKTQSRSSNNSIREKYVITWNKISLYSLIISIASLIFGYSFFRLFPSTFNYQIYFLILTETILTIISLISIFRLRKGLNSNTADSSTPLAEETEKTPNLRIFSRKNLQYIFQVIVSLSLFEGTVYLLTSESGTLIFSPFSIILKEPIEFLKYIILLVVVAQFFIGGSYQLEIIGNDEESSSYFVTNFILLLGESLTLLAMALAVRGSNPVFFLSWYFALLIIDQLWIYLVVLPMNSGQVLKIKNAVGFIIRFTKLPLISNFNNDNLKEKRKQNIDLNHDEKTFTYAFWVIENWQIISILVLVELTRHSYVDQAAVFDIFQIFFVFIVTSFAFILNMRFISRLELKVK